MLFENLFFGNLLDNQRYTRQCEYWHI